LQTALMKYYICANKSTDDQFYHIYSLPQ